jgi:hypothetical protein
VPVPAAPGAVLAGVIESTLGRIGPVAGHIKSSLGPLHRGQGIGGRGQPAVRAGQLPHRLPAFPRSVNHKIADARQAPPGALQAALLAIGPPS